MRDNHAPECFDGGSLLRLAAIQWPLRDNVALGGAVGAANLQKIFQIIHGDVISMGANIVSVDVSVQGIF